MITEHHISFTGKAPFYTLNKLTESTQRIWLVYHGYGQLARYFIKKFEGLDPKSNFIIAPQGLSKHYLNGFTGRVGSSWMTKEDRLTEIDNQFSYLDQVTSNYLDGTRELVYFGFSQGVATMFRYAVHLRQSFSKMIIWAGTIPPELNRKDFEFLTGKEKVCYFIGDEDPFYKPEMQEEQRSAIRKAMDIDPEIRVFEGGHKVDPKKVNQL